jgi:hypothetical protein
VAERGGQDGFVSRAAGIRVREADLGAATRIGSGAATEVSRLDSFTVPGHLGGLAFVRVRDRAAAHWDSAVLSRLVALRWQLGARERELLDGVAAWPLAVVEGDDGEIVGCLVPLAAHPFYYVPAEGDGESLGKVPQQVKWLVSAPKRARRAGAAAVGERDRVARATVLARVCLMLDLLHRNGIVFGDLTDRSVLFGAGTGTGGTGTGAGGTAKAFVVGCEGAVFAGEKTPQRTSAGWTAPETAARDDESTASVQSVETDRYKLALLILRVLVPAGDGLERSRDPERIVRVLDARGQRMMRDALGDDPELRPTASEWYAQLRGLIVEQLSPPVIERVVVSPALVAEGDEVRLEVELIGATGLTIEMPGRADITREVGSRVVFERFTARQSGRIGVRATNEHGEVAALSHPVRVLPVPVPEQIAVAVPEVPEGLGVLPDLARLEAALGISLAPGSGGANGAHGAGTSEPSPFDRVAVLRERLEADALPLHDLMRLGLEAERASRERDRLFPSFEEFLGDITSRRPPAR